MKTMLKQYMYLLLFVIASVAGFLFAVASSTALSAPVHKSVHHVHKHKPKWRISYKKVNASWYGCTSHQDCPWGNDHTQGQPTASGIIFDTHKPMCASYKYKLHTWVLVENLKTHKSTACEILDRGPNHALGRAIDLSHYVKNVIGMAGLGKVAIYVRND